jgi:hypothetical protein
MSLSSSTSACGDRIWGDRAAGNRALRTSFIRALEGKRKSKWWKSTTFGVLFTGIAGFLAVGCGILDVGALDREQDRLEENQRLWSRNGPTRYTVVIERLCFCPTEVTSAVRVTVTNGVVTSRTYVASGQAVPSQFASLFPTVDGAFQIVSEAIDRKADKLEVEYDSALGYPRSANIDYVKEAADEELVFHLRDLTPG